MTEETESTALTPEPTTPAATPPAEKTFTQAELDQILKDRLGRERQKHADYDQLKAAADKLKALEEAQLSEQEKLQKQLTEAQAKAERAEAVARQRAVFSAVVAEAAKLGFHDPALAARLLDASAVEFDDSGEPKNAAELVKKLADEHKYLIKQPGQSLEPFNPAGGGGQLRETDAQRRARIYSGGGQQFFDAGAAARAGGGVIWPKGTPE